MYSPWPEIKAAAIGLGGGALTVYFTRSIWIGFAAFVVVTVAAHRRSGPRWGNW